jgi:tRNA 2-thiouridine synthesizing protein A
MNENQIDTRGLSCPQPVVLVMRAIQAGQPSFEVLLDSETAVDNVSRLLRSKGFRIDRTDRDGDVHFKVQR